MTVYHLCPCDRHSVTGLPVLVALIGTRFRHSLLLLWAVFLVSIASSCCGLLLHNIRNNIVRFTFLTARQCRRVVYRSGEISVPKRHRTHRVALWIHHGVHTTYTVLIARTTVTESTGTDLIAVDHETETAFVKLERHSIFNVYLCGDVDRSGRTEKRFDFQEYVRWNVIGKDFTT